MTEGRVRLAGLARLTGSCALVAILAAPAFASDPPEAPDAQDETAPAPGPAAEEPKGDAPAAPPTLDELLGIGDDKEGETEDERAPDDSEVELERRLDEENLGDAFTLALEKMVSSADRLDERFDTGLETQRLQEDILGQLERLVDLAKKQQSQGGGSSSSSSSSSSPAGGKMKQKSQPGKRGPSQAPPSAGGNQGREGDPPPMREGELNPVLDESRSEWGTLPARVRDELLQGRREKFSSLYEHLTREYYRRLAEEGR